MIFCLSFVLVQAFLRFRPQQYDLDMPAGPVGQYCNLARDLQLQAFPEFVSGISPFLFLFWGGDRTYKGNI